VLGSFRETEDEYVRVGSLLDYVGLVGMPTEPSAPTRLLKRRQAGRCGSSGFLANLSMSTKEHQYWTSTGPSPVDRGNGAALLCEQGLLQISSLRDVPGEARWLTPRTLRECAMRCTVCPLTKSPQSRFKWILSCRTVPRCYLPAPS
jgi:hypothetical protein